MSRRGWGGAPPVDDAEARERVIEATIRCLDRSGPGEAGLSDVALELGVTRQTIYRYFPSTEQLFAAVSVVASQRFMADVRRAVEGITDPAEFVVEAMGYVIERLPSQPHLTHFLDVGELERFQRNAVRRPVLDRSVATVFRDSAIDWAAHGYGDDELRDLLELVHRLLQSMIIAPSDPPRHGAELRAYLRRWVGPAVAPVTRPQTTPA